MMSALLFAFSFSIVSCVVFLWLCSSSVSLDAASDDDDEYCARFSLACLILSLKRSFVSSLFFLFPPAIFFLLHVTLLYSSSSSLKLYATWRVNRLTVVSSFGLILSRWSLALGLLFGLIRMNALLRRVSYASSISTVPFAIRHCRKRFYWRIDFYVLNLLFQVGYF